MIGDHICDPNKRMGLKYRGCFILNYCNEPNKHLINFNCYNQSQIGGVLWNFRQFHVYARNLDMKASFNHLIGRFYDDAAASERHVK